MTFSADTYREWLAQDDAQPGYLKTDQRQRYLAALAEIEARPKPGGNGQQPMIDHALAYAARGWSVFPLHPHAKTPITAHGVKDATTDTATIRVWWERNPDANIGLACGPSGLVVIDIDADKDGIASWAALKAAHPDLPTTVTSRTGGGGFHLLYRAVAGVDVRNSAGKIAPGIDVRADGGYIVLPPSIHPNGTPYMWDDAQHPDRRDLAEFPRVLIDLLAKPKPTTLATPSRNGQHSPYAQAALDGELAKVRATTEGTRNDQLNRAAFALGQFVGGGHLDRAEVEATLTGAALDTGLSESEARATIRSGLTAGIAEPRIIPDRGLAPDALPADDAPAVPEPDAPPDDGTAAQPNRPRYILHTAAEALQPQPPIEWIVDRLFSAGSISIIVGEPGSKKSYAMLDAAVCVATGSKWLDFDTKPSPALIIDEESGNRRMARRLGEVLRGHYADESTPVYYTTLERFNLRAMQDELAIRDAIEKTGARFVVIDALADVMPGSDENAVKDVQPIFLALRAIAEQTQAGIVLIHHVNKIGGYRGSSAIKGAVDLLLLAESKPNEDTINFSFDKARDVEPFKFAARARFDVDRFDLTTAEPTNAGRKLSKSQDYVIRYLSEHVNATMADIMGHTDTCTPNAARQAVFSLAARGLVRRVDAGGQGVTALYGPARAQE